MFEPSPSALVVGRLGGKLVRLTGQQFAILAAPTCSARKRSVTALKSLFVIRRQWALDDVAVGQARAFANQGSSTAHEKHPARR
ncbi:hypothetical protein OK348_03585 [Flavobacterium sp. MXW15]|uniref:Uncharacterized protein n=1 Tax=Xanthomonas chitinilytica TaxID=2989819 RepID=A0ABT3JRG0_9XANT|nr:hypothetical protein [Xanthomonas sp. H13-6]MCW4453876.1 hypothetical protein [Flavobacterium sp. MXW15]MCW4471076.1 hypothetical protein [Xanthomonas sp. H13-6]